MQSLMGTGVQTFSAADAFSAVGRLINRNIEFAGFLAFAAAGAGRSVHLVTVQRNGVKQAVNCAQRTKVVAEGPVYQDGQDQ